MKKSGLRNDERGREKQICFTVEGKVVFSETKPTSYGSNLVLKLDKLSQEIGWTHQSRIPAHIVVGDSIRGHYRQSSENIILLDAYELLRGQEVITRACAPGYSFVD